MGRGRGDFRRAIELNPNYARAHLGYALLLSCLGRGDEALVEIKRAMEIDPLSQDVKSGYLTILEVVANTQKPSRRRRRM